MAEPAGLTLTELRALRDALIRQRARGLRTCAFLGQSVTYATDAEMAAALADLERRIARAAAPPGSGGTITFRT